MFIKIKEEFSQELKFWPDKYYKIITYYEKHQTTFQKQLLFLVENEFKVPVTIEEDWCSEIINPETLKY